MPNVLLTFDTILERESFLEFLHNIGTIDPTVNPSKYTLPTLENVQKQAIIIQKMFKTLRRDPPIRNDKERRAAVFVSGSKMAEGTVEEMNIRFLQETGSHSANVELREDIGNGVYDKTIRSRKNQKI
jgi:hypothetical protein